ncbi:Spy/CpxP family protein refolding chaperone [Rhodonellum sp.]|uniref:Spy/CpxP family protein refolding chaperone n=1 Tax=Rhodonellum sp. TaxID=2231180 RepID=UPI00271CD713|nr:hypothetical protein [Rhodonellum sp.]MDO9553752.1 hypothetical protein [Rhodonellum sp.]
MKKLILIAFLSITGIAQAQDIFQGDLFPADLIMKNREKISLTDQQADKIKKIHSVNAGEFSTLKWDLAAANSKLKALLSETKVNQDAVQKQMDVVLAIENNLKKKQLTNLVAIKNELNENQVDLLKETKGIRVTGYASQKTGDNASSPFAITVKSGESEGPKPNFYLSEKGKLTRTKDINTINPKDIEKMEVLKGKAAIDKVGEVGKNGIVIITLKKN